MKQTAILAAASALLVATLATTTSAAIIKLNDPLVAPQAVVFFGVSPDTNTVIYVVGDNATHHSALYAVPVLRTSSPVTLNSPPVGSAVGPYTISSGEPRITADNQRVVYQSDEDAEDVIRLYSVPITGAGPRVALSSQLAAIEDVGTFNLTADGTRVVYLAGNPSDATTFKLWSIPVTGGSAVDITSSTGRGARANFKITPDSTHVVFDARTGSTADLFSTAITGGTITQLTTFGRLLNNYFDLPNNTNVIFQSDPQGVNRAELFTVPVNGSTASLRLHPITTDVDEDAFINPIFSFDKTKLVFSVIRSVSPFTGRTYSTNVDGSSQTLLNQGGDVTSTPYAYNQAGTKVLVRGRDVAESGYGTHIVSAFGGDLVRATVPLYQPGPIISNATTGNTGRYAFLMADITSSGGYEVLRYDIDNDSYVAALTPNLGSNTFNYPFRLTADDDLILFSGRRTGDTIDTLLVYSFSLGMLSKVTSNFVSGGNLDLSTLDGYRFAKNDTAVVYAAEQDIDLVTELYVNTVAAPVPLTAGRVWNAYE